MGAPFHADLHAAPGTAAGSFVLLDPAGSPVLITHVRFSTDTGQRFVVGVADVDGQRIFAGWIGANGGAIADLHLDTGATGMAGGKIVLITAAASGWDVAIEGCELP